MMMKNEVSKSLIPYCSAQESFLSCSASTSTLRYNHLFHSALVKLKTILSCNALKVPTSLSSQNNKEFLNVNKSSDDQSKSSVSNLDTPNKLEKIASNLKTESEIKTPSLIKPYILGIDPGVSGALALIDVSSGSNVFVDAFDMPTFETVIKGKTRNRIDLYKLSEAIKPYADKVRFALVEEVNARPEDGRASIFAFGFATGAVCGAVASFNIPLESVTPAVWKASMGLGSDKTQSIQRALKHFPNALNYLTRKKDHGRAEAMLLAVFAAKHMRRDV